MNPVAALGFAWSAAAWPPSPPCILPVPRSLDTCCAQDLCWMLRGVYGFGLEVPLQREERHVDNFMSGEPAWETGEGFPEEVALMLCLEKQGEFERGRKWGDLGKGRDVGNHLETSLHSRASPSSAPLSTKSGKSDASSFSSANANDTLRRADPESAPVRLDC